MGLLDRLTGTRHPDAGLSARPAGEVRAALLGVGGPDVPYVVRTGRGDENAELVAEWRVAEPTWHGFFARTDVSRVLRIRLRLVPEKHEVRAVEEQLEVTWVRGVPTLSVSAEVGRGPGRTVSRQWTLGRNEEGRLAATETFRFDSADMKDPVRQAVLDAGWTWRGVLIGRL
ncbi:hypothetical protein GTY65_17680 [Streptomyces sp. SID8379]|uniref:hypothetical protein n=1 Tax=unclassified Streptomyces TaxID=2593676 RepID=UPI000373BBE4|nr:MULTISPECIES: hypothetical protein [unclassified Streptomyces]MYW65872.1 hypothetical protein [Streptomyces sp. SID8379]